MVGDGGDKEQSSSGAPIGLPFTLVAILGWEIGEFLERLGRGWI